MPFHTGRSTTSPPWKVLSEPCASSWGRGVGYCAWSGGSENKETHSDVHFFFITHESSKECACMICVRESARHGFFCVFSVFRFWQFCSAFFVPPPCFFLLYWKILNSGPEFSPLNQSFVNLFVIYVFSEKLLFFRMSVFPKTQKRHGVDTHPKFIISTICILFFVFVCAPSPKQRNANAI